MFSLSSYGPGSQQPEPPERPDLVLQPFDLHAETVSGEHVDDDDFDYDGDTLTADDDGDDPPPANAGAAVPLVISAPPGPQPVRAGFTVAAVVSVRDEDGEENFSSAAMLTPDKMRTITMAKGVACFKAMHAEKLPIEATHIVVNDETGREVFRRPVLRAA